MGNIKNNVGLSEWLTFKLADSALLDPPEVKLRLRPISGLAGLNADPGDRRLSSTILKMIQYAVADWDLAEAGVPVPCTDESWTRLAPFLAVFFGELLADQKTPTLLGIAIVTHAANPENFLKN